MNTTSRRDFLRLTAAGTVGLVASPSGVAAATEGSVYPGIPAHKPLVVAGVHGYPARHSVAAGQTLAFHLSSDQPYRVGFYRLGQTIDDPAGDDLLQDAGEFPARVQPIHPGSYVHIPKRLTGSPRALSLECWVRPWSVAALAGLITQEDKESDEGFALGIGKDGYVGFFLGNGVGPDEVEIHRTAPGTLKRGEWHHLVATWDGQTKRIWVNGVEAGSWSFAGPFRVGKHPLRLGAMGQRSETLRFLDGDLAMAVIYDQALEPATIRQRHAEQGLRPATGGGVLGCWAFAEERGERVADESGHARHGRIINHATWMIGGPAMNPAVPRFGDYDPERDAHHGHGLRFASDDLFDCRWEQTLRWKVPVDAKPGIYVARVRYERQGKPQIYDLTFLVRRAARRKPAPMLVLCSTNTWRAYNGAPFGVWPESQHAVIGTGGLPNAAGDPPAYCLYRGHAAGQGTYQVGLRMPWPVAGPYVLYGGPTRYSHLMRGERFAQNWLTREGYRFDVAADDDLHREPALLRDYLVVVLNGHSEYWSLPMLRGLGDFLRGGGNLVVLSGNSIFWRVSFDADCGVMECRKVDAPGHQLESDHRGECWHSHDGQRGGLLRDCGHPGWHYTGLETLGWNNQGNPKNFGPYLATGTDHFLFHQPEETGLKAGDPFGVAPDGTTLANGHEFDIRLSTLAAMQEEPNPQGGSVPADPSGITSLANGVVPWKEGGAAFDYFFRPIRPKTDQGGEMIWWERPEGGRIFNAGSIGSGWALHADARFQALMRNVLHHFGIPRPQ